MPARRAALERRSSRLEALGPLDKQVTASLSDVWNSGRKPTEIRVRSSFIALTRPLSGPMSDSSPPPEASRPPLARLITSKGLALRTALTSLFVAQCSLTSPANLQGKVPNPEDDSLGWRHLVLAPAVHDPDSVRAVRLLDNQVRQIKRAFDRLAGAEIGIVEQRRRGVPRKRYEEMQLLHEGGVRATGPAPAYRLPKADEPTVDFPIDFFLNGWLNVLEDSEIASWLMFRHRCGSPSAYAAGYAGVELSGEDRLATYGLARTVWDTHQLLGVLGLVVHQADGRRRRDGSVEDYNSMGKGVRHRFRMADTPLGDPAMVSAITDIEADLDNPDGSWAERSQAGMVT